MASGHCEPRKQAEHMAAPTNLQRDESSCQPGAVHTWALRDISLVHNDEVAFGAKPK